MRRPLQHFLLILPSALISQLILILLTAINLALSPQVSKESRERDSVAKRWLWDSRLLGGWNNTFMQLETFVISALQAGMFNEGLGMAFN